MGKIEELKQKMTEIRAALEVEKKATIAEIGYLCCALKSATQDKKIIIEKMIDERISDLGETVKLPSLLEKSIKKIQQLQKTEKS